MLLYYYILGNNAILFWEIRKKYQSLFDIL